ncbi:hypothetical protein RLW55_09470 [Hyphomicrobium sp. B1]
MTDVAVVVEVDPDLNDCHFAPCRIFGEALKLAGLSSYPAGSTFR